MLSSPLMLDVTVTTIPMSTPRRRFQHDCRLYRIIPRCVDAGHRLAMIMMFVVNAAALTTVFDAAMLLLREHDGAFMGENKCGPGVMAWLCFA